jgi:hypothetical protein
MFNWRVTIPSTCGPFTCNLASKWDPENQPFVSTRANYNNARVTALGWLSLLSDNPVAPLPPRVLQRFIAKMRTDLFGVIKTYAELANLLMKSEKIVDGSPVREFIQPFMKTPCFRVYLEWYRSGDPVLYRWLLSFLLFAKAAEFHRPELRKEAYASWLKNEDRLRSLELNDVLVENLRKVVYWLLHGFSLDLQRLTPHHGPGNTSDCESRGVEDKNQSLSIPPKAWYMMLSNSASSLYPDYQGYYDFTTRPAALTFVSKDYKSLRTICMQPGGTMYLEQALRDQLYAFFDEGPISAFVTLRDQTRNQRASLIGSLTRLIDTIDLSSASDLVAWALILRITPHSLLRYLEALRVPLVLYRKELHQMEKFAPMGSALCFPVQCIVFTAITIAVGLSQSLGQDVCSDHLPVFPGHVDELQNLFDFAFGPKISDPRNRYVYPTIYGDDICLDSRLTSNVMLALERLGFLVNHGKSFTGQDSFRESCGSFHLRGTDVTMLKYKGSYPESEVLDISELAGFIDTANRALEFGYNSTRSLFVRLSLYSRVRGVAPNSCGRNPVLFSNEEDQSLAIKFVEGTRSPNPHLRGRWNRDLYQPEIQSLSLKPCGVTRHTPQYANYAYLQWQRAQWYRVSDPPPWEGSVRADYRDVVPALRWTVRQAGE